MAVRTPSTDSLPTDRPADPAFRSLIRTLGLVERVMQPYFAQFGISGSQWGVLRALQRAEAEGLAGLRLTDLSERLLIRPPSVTGVVDRLERAGLVARDHVPGDMRARRVTMTAKGRELVNRVLAVHPRQIEMVMGVLNEAEQRELHRVLAHLDEHLRNLADVGKFAAEK